VGSNLRAVQVNISAARQRGKAHWDAAVPNVPVAGQLGETRPGAGCRNIQGVHVISVLPEHLDSHRRI